MYIVSANIRERLMAKIDTVNGPTQPHMQTRCWPWTGSRNNKGYGMVRPGGRQNPTCAHRVFYEVFVGPIEPGNEIDHVCEFEQCCNPEHLEQITAVLNNHYHNRGRMQVLEPGEVPVEDGELEMIL